MAITAARTGLAAAWLVHLFTASGVVLAFLALIAIVDRQWALALLWLVIALVVDGLDGTFARAAKVGDRIPRIDGAVLDLVIDYLNYVFVPAAFIWRAELIPPSWAPFLAAAILISALYNFARRDMKTADNYFRGFPALWNVVAIYLFIAQPGPGAGAIIVASLAILTFAPVHFVHPFRVRAFFPALPILALVWAASTAALLWTGWEPAIRSMLFWASAASAFLLIAAGLLRTLRGAKADAQDP